MTLRDALPGSIDFGLLVDPFTGTASAGTRRLTLGVSLPLRRDSDGSGSGSGSGVTAKKPRPSTPRLTLRRAEWLTRQNQDELRQRARLDEIASEEEDGASIVMTAVENLSEAAVEMDESGAFAQEGNAESNAGAGTFSPPSSAESLSPLVFRTWHHLVSLSTKEKRQDLVSYAMATTQGTPPQPLTGFVLAGKPGLVVLEYPLPCDDDGDAAARATAIRDATSTIDSYWSSIKSRSWADIPAGHKKVTETHREEYVPRAFYDMREMTGAEEIGGKEAMRGGWRNDMSKVEQWLKTKGIGGRLRDVLGADW